MYKKTSSFPIINYLITFIMLAWMIYSGYMIVNGSYAILRYILFVLSLDTFFGVQVLLLALSMGKSDKNPDINYGPVVPFNKIMLGVYAIYIVVFHVILVLKIMEKLGIKG